jgi:hypothetical protein
MKALRPFIVFLMILGTAGWENGRIVSLEFKGPKKR